MTTYTLTYDEQLWRSKESPRLRRLLARTSSLWEFGGWVAEKDGEPLLAVVDPSSTFPARLQVAQEAVQEHAGRPVAWTLTRESGQAGAVLWTGVAR